MDLDDRFVLRGEDGDVDILMLLRMAFPFVNRGSTVVVVLRVLYIFFS